MLVPKQALPNSAYRWVWQTRGISIKQISFANARFGLVTKRTRRPDFLDEMNLVVLWTRLAGLIRPFASSGTTARGGRPSFPVQPMFRIQCHIDFYTQFH